MTTLATSVPVPPVGPPPAFGTGASFGALFVGGVGVAGEGVFAVGLDFVGAGMSFGVVAARGGGVTGVDGGGVGSGCRGTTPTARGPGGAATRLTVYTGGLAFGGPGRARNAAAMSDVCSKTANPNGPPSRVVLGARYTTSPAPAQRRDQCRRHLPDASPRARARPAHSTRLRPHAGRHPVHRAFQPAP